MNYDLCGTFIVEPYFVLRSMPYRSNITKSALRDTEHRHRLTALIPEKSLFMGMCRLGGSIGVHICFDKFTLQC